MSMTTDIPSLTIHNEDINSVDEDLDIEEQKQQTKFDLSDISKAIQLASEGTITAKTVTTYNKYIPLSHLYNDLIATLLI